MKLFRALPVLLACSLLSAAALAAENDANPKATPAPTATPAGTPRPATKNKDARKAHGPGLLDKLWTKIVPAKKPAAPGAVPSDAVERPVGKQKVMVSMSLDPQPLKLSDTRQVKVTLHVANKGAKLVQMEFPTTQRIEVVIRAGNGKLVEQWSEDRTFANEPGMVSINPGERLEYSVTLSTRDMVAGQPYTIEALFPNYESLRLQRNVTPEK